MRDVFSTRSLLAATALLLLVAPVLAQTTETAPGPYRLGPGDVLQLTVLQQPNLDREIVIRPDSTAVVPLVGEVLLGGLTVREAETQLRQKLRLFNPSIRDLTLTVTQYNALRVYVMGEVNNPGSYTFSSPPTLWDAIREAGGPREGARLESVRVVRVESGRSTTATYDLTGLISGTSSEALGVTLRPGDTVIVPGQEGVNVSPEAGVQVFGSVARPGTYLIQDPEPLVSVLMLAGAPLESGNLRKVWWVHRDPTRGFVSRQVNLQVFLEQGNAEGNPLIYPGDTVKVEERRPGFFRTTYPIILGTLTTAATIAFALDRISRP